MSSTEEADLKAGHAPAVKAGGMRITQHKPKAEGEEPAAEMTPEETEEFGTGTEEGADPHHQSILVSGAVSKGDKDFPAAAVKAYHDKPQPTHQKPTNSPRPNIQQPRR